MLCLGLVLVSCDAQSKKNSNHNSEELTYSKVVELGDVRVNFPFLDGYKECSEDSVVAEWISGFPGADHQIDIIAFYLDNETYNSKDLLGTIHIENYFQIWRANSPRETKTTLNQYQQLAKSLDQLQLSKIDFNAISKKYINNEILSHIQFGEPNFIEIYESNNVKSAVAFVKMNHFGHEKLMIMINNVIWFKDRLLMSAYYLEFEGSKSIDEAKRNNKNFINSLLVTNNI